MNGPISLRFSKARLYKNNPDRLWWMDREEQRGSDVWKESMTVNRSSCLGSLYFP